MYQEENLNPLFRSAATQWIDDAGSWCALEANPSCLLNTDSTALLQVLILISGMSIPSSVAQFTLIE